VIKRIVFTGGGSAGHVTPNIALINQLLEQGSEVSYIGSTSGMEKSIVEHLPIAFYSVHSGKLRRYFSWKNFTDPFLILLGIIQSFFLIKKIKPNIVFSKGGFVAFPVVVAAWLNRVPVIAHESDMSPGLANKLSFPFCKKICLTFDAAKKYFKQNAIVTGTPIRQSLFDGNKQKGMQLTKFGNDKPCLLIIGGGQGAQSINQCVRQALPELCEKYNVIHLCGPGKIDNATKNEAYFQIEYAKQELADLFAQSEIVISRSGANSVYELLALKKPHIFVPLPLKSSRGDQIENANYFVKRGVSELIKDDELNSNRLIAKVNEVYNKREILISQMEKLGIQSATPKILSLLEEYQRC
jgi:UDP-N-acetylglucosamine--N-acetylmuramyl-(pentapeptide) pyrophosphoryl-undecaprenol N-acetylglucosamine transferase